MDFVDLMRGLGGDLGLADFAPGTDGTWAVEVDGMPVVFAEHAESAHVQVSAPVCVLPKQGHEKLLRVMLESMFMCRATGGARFSLNAEDQVSLRLSEPLATLDVESLKAKLERFVNVLEQWRGITAEYGRASGEQEAVERSAAEEVRRMCAFQRV